MVFKNQIEHRPTIAYCTGCLNVIPAVSVAFHTIKKMPKETNIAEEYVRVVNDNLFLREFTFTENELKTKDNQEVELADNIVWLDEILLLIQVKWRNPKNIGTEEQEIKWFKNKVLNVAKGQIKSTIKYFEDTTNFEIENGRGFKVNLFDAPVSNSRKLIIYLPSEKLPEREKFIKFYDSKDVGLIHLFNFEDYKWICQYLITPFEIVRYLDFREVANDLFGNDINLIPEQLLLGKFLSGEDIFKIDPKYIEFLDSFEEDISEFDVSALLQKFYSKTIKQNLQTDYIPIVKEIAKLSRFELREFKIRHLLSVEKSKSAEYTIPYRIVFPRTGIGFVFIPIPFGDKNFADNWQNALKNFTYAHKYEQRLKKCIGVITFRYENSDDYLEMYWMLIDATWVKDELMDKSLKENFPFREVEQQMLGEYKFKKK